MQDQATRKKKPTGPTAHQNASPQSVLDPKIPNQRYDLRRLSHSNSRSRERRPISVSVCSPRWSSPVDQVLRVRNRVIRRCAIAVHLLQTPIACVAAGNSSRPRTVLGMPARPRARPHSVRHALACASRPPIPEQEDNWQIIDAGTNSSAHVRTSCGRPSRSCCCCLHPSCLWRGHSRPLDLDAWVAEAVLCGVVTSYLTSSLLGVFLRHAPRPLERGANLVDGGGHTRS